MPSKLRWALLLAISTSALAAGPAQPSSAGSGGVKLLVLELSAGAGVKQDVAAAVGETVLAEVTGLGMFQVSTPKDVQTLLGLERQRQLLGCSEGSATCMTELAGALGTRYVLSGSLSRVGETYQLQLQMLDSERAQPVGRALRFAPSLEELRRQLPYQVAEATGAPPPRQPSRVGPYALLGGGAASVLAATAVGVVTYAQIQVLAHDLQLGENGDRAALQPLSYYQEQSAALQRQQLLAWALAGAGAAMIAGGLYWNTRLEAGPVSRVAVTLAPSGVAIVGVWP